MNEMKKTVISALVVLAALLATALWLYMGWKECQTRQTALNTKKTQVAALREKVAKIPGLRLEKTKLQEELAEYETILPNGQELDKIFDTLSEFTKDSGVTILEFRPEQEWQGTPGAAQSSYKRVSYSLKLEGDFFRVRKFINLLENYKRFVKVDSFDMAKRDLDGQLDDTALRISTFIYDPKAQPGATGARGGPDAIPFVLNEERAKQYVMFAGQSTVRDPFTNPLTKRQVGGTNKALIATGPKDLSPAEELELVQGLRSELSKISDLLRDGDFEKAAETYSEMEVKLGYQFKDVTLDPQLTEVRAKATEIGETLKTGRGKKLLEIVTTQHEKMKQSFEDGDYETVVKTYEGVEDVVKRAVGIDYKGLAEATKEVELLGERGKTCCEFTAFDIVVQGVIWMKDGRAAAIINQQTLIEGDKMKFDAASSKAGKTPAADVDVFVQAISRDKITFRYKGERINKLLVE